MNEIFEISDRVTVFRDGKHIRTMATADAERNELIKLMVGRELKNTFPERTHTVGAEKILEVEHLTGNGDIDLNFHAYRGEILGFAGLVGAGRTEFAQMLFGVARVHSGTLRFKGKPLRMKRPLDSIRQGIALIPEDRKKQGILLSLSVAANISLAKIREISKFTVIDRKKEQEIVNKFVQAIAIKTPSNEQIARNLSGGNQQKVVLAKWLATDAELIIFDEPTRGIDVGAKYEIYKLMDELAANGKTILMISSDLEELIGMADRMIVMAEGHISGELNREEFAQERILAYASKQYVGGVEQ